MKPFLRSSWAGAALALLLGANAAAAAGDARVVSYSWPGQAGFSDRYRVFVRCGAGPEREVQVLMSRALWQGDYRAEELEGRTFSFVPLSYDPAAGPLSVRAVKIFGGAATSVTVHPRSYGLEAKVAADGKEITFQVASPNRYVSVHFAGGDNQTAPNGWIKHMLCIFIDPPETDVPDRKAPGVVAYATNVPPERLQSAETIVFPSGYHNLRDYRRGGIIDDDGQLRLQKGQSLYLEGGAFVEGIVGQQPEGWEWLIKDCGQRVYGRGVLSGRQYLWPKRKDHVGPAYGQLLKIGSGSRVEGIIAMESPMHGIVGGAKVEIRNLKFLGWHCNNDGIRVNSGSEVSHSFLRAVDDHFYNFNIHVHDVVLWAGHNGSILTYGWAGSPDYGKPGNQDRSQQGGYRSGGSVFEDVDIIHPEWIALGNNNGLVMSQVRPDYRPFDYGGGTTTLMRRIRIEGRIPGLVNLKPHSAGVGDILVVPVDAGKVGYLGDLVLKDISVDAQSGKSRIKGVTGASKDGKETFFIQNLRFLNVRIGGIPVTAVNAARYFEIDPATTQGIVFE